MTAIQDTCEITTTTNETKKQFKSSHAFHRTSCGFKLENAVRVQFRLEKLKSFDLVTQE
jgi:hypothetical protein